MNTTDKLSFFTLALSILVAIFSWYSFAKTDELSKNAFNRNYRPYVTTTNFVHLNENNTYVPVMNIMLMKILNAPALISKQQLSFFQREGTSEKLIFSHPDYKSHYLYPLDNNQITINTDIKVISHEIALKMRPNKLIRKIHIEYEWLSDSTLKYYYNSEWVYNIESHDWEIITQKAN